MTTSTATSTLTVTPGAVDEATPETRAFGRCVAVLDRGFVYVGLCTVVDGWLHIAQARCVRRWGTTNGLGELAARGPLTHTVLEPISTIAAPLASVIHLIICTADDGTWS